MKERERESEEEQEEEEENQNVVRTDIEQTAKKCQTIFQCYFEDDFSIGF